MYQNHAREKLPHGMFQLGDRGMQMLPLSLYADVDVDEYVDDDDDA